MTLGMTLEEMIKSHRDEAVKQIEKERTEKMFELDKWTEGVKLFCKHLEEDKSITKVRYSYYNEPSIEYYDLEAPVFDRIWISVFNWFKYKLSVLGPLKISANNTVFNVCYDKYFL